MDKKQETTNKELKNEKNIDKKELENKEKEIIDIDDKEDEQFNKILKFVWIGVFLFIFLFWFINYTFLNIKNNSVMITESFFSKKLDIYNDSGIRLLNPLQFPKKTEYTFSLQNVSFQDSKSIDEQNKNDINTTGVVNKNNVYNETFIEDSISVNTKDEISIKVKLDVSYRLKNDIDSITKVYKNTWNGNFIEKIVLPTITSSVSSVYSQKKLMSIVNKDTNNENILEDISISTLLKDKITSELDKVWFEVVSFTFWGITPSEWVTKTLEELFNSQNKLEIERTKSDILTLKNENSLKELELTSSIHKELEKNNIDISEYQKIKMIQIFEDKWNWNTIPNNLSELLK